MSAANRAAILTKLHKVLKKHYQPVEPPSDRSVLEHLLYAAVLEGADFETADENFAKLQENFFDWNEIRVTTITELAETLATVSDAAAAAQRVKKTLQAVFETHSSLQTHYTFDLEVLRKQNLGKAVAELEKFDGVSKFGIAYAAQNALGGHQIALSRGALEALVAVGAMNDSEFAKGECPGMERAIPKNKGVEFFSLLHQLACDLTSSPQSTRVRGILTETDSEAKDRLAQFNARRAEAAAAAKEARDQRIAEAREARAQEAREAEAKAAKEAQRKAKKAAAGKPAEVDDKKKPAAPPVEDKSKAKPAAPQPAKPAAKPAEDAKSKKPVLSKGLTKRKPK
jgi:endonuclease-3